MTDTRQTNRWLMVPIRVDALCLRNGEMMVEPAAHFDRLPFVMKDASGKPVNDVNPDTANLASRIRPRAFSDRSHWVGPGIHLHWALPDALSRGVAHEPAHDDDQDNVKFPSAPNRWLVIRSGGDLDEKKWIVESDYLFPPQQADGFEPGYDSISYPIYNRNKPLGQPYRRMGRRLKLPETGTEPKRSTKDEYLSQNFLDHDPRNRLTALGYDEPLFAAIYSNCHSVFGLHDDLQPETINGDIRYEVFGWYSDPRADDPFSLFVEDFRHPKSEHDLENQLRGLLNADAISRERHHEVVDADTILTEQQKSRAFVLMLQQQFGWTLPVESASSDACPNRMLCYCRLDIEQSGLASASVEPVEAPIAVGNTAAEALAAWLAHDISGPSNSRKLEDQLEAVSHYERVAHHGLDIDYKFRETRHAQAFQPIDAGHIWTIRETDHAGGQTAGDVRSAKSQVPLPLGLAHAVNELNQAQQAYNRAQAEIASLREELFSDWWKYMMCCYPPQHALRDYADPDLARRTIERTAPGLLADRIAAAGRLERTKEPVANGNLAERVAWHLQHVRKLLVNANHQIENMKVKDNEGKNRLKPRCQLQLAPTPAPGFWVPSDPVVFLHLDNHPATRHTQRHGRDGTDESTGFLLCRAQPDSLVAFDPGALTQETITNLRDALDTANRKEAGARGWVTQTEAPWNSIAFEWEVEVQPWSEGGNTSPTSAGYDEDFVQQNFELPESSMEIVRKSAEQSMAGTRFRTLFGRTVMHPHAGDLLRQRLERAFAEPENREHQGLLKAYARLNSEEFHGLAQSLGGFTAGLLQKFSALQLDVADPIGFKDYQQFTASIAKQLPSSIHHEPVPDNPFQPIRSGRMIINGLSIIDTFGQTIDVIPTTVIGSEEMAATDDEVGLSPRINQPARLSFRWLSAVKDDVEVNEHPATTPICGWLVPNNMDRSLAIYDDQGMPLGTIDLAGHWRPPAGPVKPGEGMPASIKNRHLLQMVDWLLSRDQPEKFMDHFISTADSALENIDPENFANHQARALLMGRPIALVRACFNLELLGRPARDQGWTQFRLELEGQPTSDHGLTRVKFPVRIGEHQQLNDGVVGYWVEQENGYRDDLFIAPQSETTWDNPERFIRTHDDARGQLFEIPHAIDDDPVTLSLLMDPRGLAHATTSILPTKAIGIPPDQYEAALNSIQVTFTTAPILTPPEQVRLPLPAEPGYQWSWLDTDGVQWRQVPQSGIKDISHHADYGPASEIREGWLQLTPAPPTHSENTQKDTES